MTPEQTATALAYAVQADKRIEPTDTTLDIWETGLTQVTFNETIWAIKNYAATTTLQNGFPPPPINPGEIRKRVHAERDRAQAKTRALEPPARHKSPDSYRHRNPEHWDRLVHEGAQTHLADLQRRGIQLTPNQQKRANP